jgi:hypothetical protein
VITINNFFERSEKMTWEPEVEELEFRKKLAEQMGGPQGAAGPEAHGL